MNAPAPFAPPIATGAHGAGTDAERRRFIGGSDVAGVVGVSKWKTPLQVWESKTGRAVPPPPDPKRERILSRGKRWEQPALEMLIDELEARGHTVELVGRSNRYIDGALDFLACEIDAELILDGEACNVEVKTVHPFAAGEWGEMDTDEVPIHYSAQAMHGLGITGKRICVVGCLIGADLMLPYFVERDEDTIASMRQQCLEFWTNNVLADLPPDPVSLSDMARLYLRRNVKPVDLDEAAADAFAQLIACRQQVSTIEANAKDLELQVCQGIHRAIGLDPDAEVPEDTAELYHAGMVVGTWKRQSRESIDSRALKEAHPDIAHQFTRTSEFRVLRAKKSKK